MVILKAEPAATAGGGRPRIALAVRGRSGLNALLYLLLAKSGQNGRYTTNGEFYEGKQGKTGVNKVILLHLKGCFTPHEWF